MCQRALKEIIIREGLRRTGISLAFTEFGGQSDSDEATIGLEERNLGGAADNESMEAERFGNICLASELGLRPQSLHTEDAPQPEKGEGEQEHEMHENSGEHEVKKKNEKICSPFQVVVLNSEQKMTRVLI